MKKYRMTFLDEYNELDGRLFNAWDDNDAWDQAVAWVWTYNETWGTDISLVSVELA